MSADDNRPRLPGQLRWWAVRRGRWSGVTSDRQTFLMATDGLPLERDRDWTTAEHEADAAAWLRDAGPPELLLEATPIVWAVYAGRHPGIYQTRAEAERQAGRGGRVRPFSSPAWGMRYAQTGVFGMQPGMQDVRACYDTPWQSPAYVPGWALAHANIAVEEGRWALRLLPFRELPPWAVRGAYENRMNAPTMAALALSDALQELLEFLWGEGEAGGLFGPKDEVGLHIVTNCRSWPAFARGDWRLPTVERARARLLARPVCVVHDPADLWCQRTLKEK